MLAARQIRRDSHLITTILFLRIFVERRRTCDLLFLSGPFTFEDKIDLGYGYLSKKPNPHRRHWAGAP